MSDAKFTKHYIDLLHAARGIGESGQEHDLLDMARVRYAVADVPVLAKALHDQGMTERAIAAELNEPKSTIHDILRPPVAGQKLPEPGQPTPKDPEDNPAELVRRQRENYLRAISLSYREVLAWSNDEFSATANSYLIDNKFRKELSQIARIGEYGEIDLEGVNRGARALVEALAIFEKRKKA